MASFYLISTLILLGFVTPGPSNAALSCLNARQLCSEDPVCSQILEILPKVCGLELVSCSTVTVTKCQAALRTLQGFPYFSPTCLCQEPHRDPECNQIREFIFDHPCGIVNNKESDPYPIDALPTCNHALSVCQNDGDCQKIYNNFQQACKVQNDKCQMETWRTCQSAWSQLRLSPLFGCICPAGKNRTCDRVFKAVNGNPCIGKGNSDSGQIELKSTCHLALNECERDGSCSRYLDQVKKMCDPITCDRNKCMRAIRDFYANIPERHSLDIAFCLCKNTPSPDEQCLRAQSLLHPVCAQQPEGGAFDVGGPNNQQVACQDIARVCNNNPECKPRLERYNQVCSVDSKTTGCAGPPDACRKGMIRILGTELRTNCGCEGTAADFRELYDCIGWHRSLWVNPCVVEAQKDYHRIRGNLLPSPPDNSNANSGTTSGFRGGGRVTPVYTEPPIRTRPPPPNRKTRPPPPPPRTPSWQNPNNQNPNRWPTKPNNWNSPTFPPTPMMPTVPPKYPSVPWQIFTVRSTTPSTTMSTTTSSTTTTLPPKFCLLERPGQPVKYIREGYKKRLYKHDDPECSELCECNMGEVLSCKVLECIERDACNGELAFYSHNSPFYQAHRGQCLCYSGSFVCSKPPKDVELSLQQGVYLYLGYSQKDEALLKKVTKQGALEAIGAIQGLVSYHNVNSNKSECRILLSKHSGENIVLQAVMDEFEENREKGNLTAELLNREKEECYEALESISRKINTNDADMRSHVILSMIKVAAAEADVPALPPSSGWRSSGCFSLLVFNVLLVIQSHHWLFRTIW